MGFNAQLKITQLYIHKQISCFVNYPIPSLILFKKQLFNKINILPVFLPTYISQSAA